MNHSKPNSHRCPACRRKYVNHPGLIPLCRELQELKRKVRRYLLVCASYSRCGIKTEPIYRRQRNDAWNELKEAVK